METDLALMEAVSLTAFSTLLSEVLELTLSRYSGQQEKAPKNQYL